ncbi:hypothetical protein SAMN05444274_104431 [Mariniphaga anaerophila]|uniref:Uncharacterized protein n=1 Tax=Mariniphaga anaerophila TaxID=1484053 RepID=A0A1M5AR91_9BACT|nr:hypothetical protein [Mariniphaga anaerophila]SHF32617.1 hypothetical protein SAMN05444274_104431 [Mariniphaga anaerophila]
MNNKLQKTGMGTLTIIAALVVTFLTLDVYRANAGNNKLNEAAYTTSDAEIAAFANYLTEEKEAELNTETWMLNVDNFFMDYHLAESTDAPLGLEAWMKDLNYFGNFAYLETEAEEALNLESWMLNENLFESNATKATTTEVSGQRTPFGRRTMILMTDNDPKLKVEYWMLDYRRWNIK